MGAQRVQYQIVGRYMNGKTVTGYHLQSIESGKAGKYTKEQVCFLVGREQVTNCSCQIYKDGVLLRGKGMSLDDLPVQYEDGKMKNTENMGKIANNATAADVMTKFTIVGKLTSGRNTVGYVVQNAGLGIKKVKRSQVIELARAGKITNARVQVYQGKDILRGVGCNLDELPAENIGGATESTPATNNNEDGITVNAKTASADTIKVAKKLAHNIGERVAIRNVVINDSSKNDSNKARLSFETNFDKEALMNTIDVTFNNTRDIVMSLAITLSSDASKAMGELTTKSFKDLMTTIKTMIEVKNELDSNRNVKSKEVSAQLQENECIEITGSNFSEAALKFSKKLAHNIGVRVPIRNVKIRDFAQSNDAHISFITNEGNLNTTIDLSATNTKDIYMRLGMHSPDGKMLKELGTKKFDELINAIKSTIKSVKSLKSEANEGIEITGSNFSEAALKFSKKLAHNIGVRVPIRNVKIRDFNQSNDAHLTFETNFEGNANNILQNEISMSATSAKDIYMNLSIYNSSGQVLKELGTGKFNEIMTAIKSKVDDIEVTHVVNTNSIAKVIMPVSSFKTNGEH